MGLLQLIMVAVGLNFFVFTAAWLFAQKVDNYSIVDIVWSYMIAVTAVVFQIFGSGWVQRREMIAVIALIWGLRLGNHLLVRIKKEHPHEDGRYVTLRETWKDSVGRSFFFFYQAQAVSVVLISIPFLWISQIEDPIFSLQEFIGMGLFALAITGETLADRQLKQFKADVNNKGKVCEVGLWNYSRHPNYFFEWLNWVAFATIAASQGGWGWGMFYAPAVMLSLLLRVTGIPTTEKQSLKSKGELYARYQKTTSSFVPWFKKI